MKENTVPGVYLLNIDMGCEQAKEEFKRMGFTDGEKQDFQRFTPQVLSVTPLWLVWHGTIHSGNMLLKSDEELIPLGISSKTELPIRRLSEIVREHSHRTGRYWDETENGDYSLERLCRFERTSERCMAAVRQDGWELAHVPEEVKTLEMCRLALDNSADLAYENLELLHYVPFPDICLEYIKANNGCNVYSLCKMMEARTGEKFTYQQMTDFYNGKPLNVRRMEMPDGVQKDKAVKFDKEKQEFSFSAIRQERKRGLRM